MGWTPVNKVEIRRVFNPERKIIVTVTDDVTGPDTKEFPFADKVQAFAYALERFNELAM